ncbi:MAG: RNA polymerase sigma factor [Planctomycetota bacterium]
MKPNGYTDMGGTGSGFATTQWTAIGQIRSGDGRKRDLVGDLLKKYWKPVYCYLRHKGYDNEQAKDLTQGFFQEVVLSRKLIHQADKAKGRFRTFLLLALERYLKSVHRKKTAKKRIPKDRIFQIEQIDPADLPEPVPGLTPKDSFNYAWVSALLDKMLEEVEAECQADGKTLHWKVFEAKVVQPIMENTEPPSLTDICEKYGVEDGTKASNMIVTVKRRVQAVLKSHLRQSVSSNAEVSEELRELMQFYVGRSARQQISCVFPI